MAESEREAKIDELPLVLQQRESELKKALEDQHLLLWLHAEAVWQRDQLVRESEQTRSSWRAVVEQWERGHQDVVLPYTVKLEDEVERLRREVEFEANAIDLTGSHPVGHGFVKGDMRCECGEQMADLAQWQGEHWLKFRVCACVSDEQADLLINAGFTRPVCAVHPDGGGER